MVWLQHCLSLNESLPQQIDRLNLPQPPSAERVHSVRSAGRAASVARLVGPPPQVIWPRDPAKQKEKVRAGKKGKDAQGNDFDLPDFSWEELKARGWTCFNSAPAVACAGLSPAMAVLAVLVLRNALC